MPKLFVSEIQPQMQVDAAFRIADRQLRANRQGNLYLLMQLQDRTGVISAMRWNADEKLAERFVKGSYVQVQGASQLHNGILQLIVNQIALVEEKTLDPVDFDAGNRVDVEQLWSKLGELIGTITNERFDILPIVFIETLRSKNAFAWHLLASRRIMLIRVDC